MGIREVDVPSAWWTIFSAVETLETVDTVPPMFFLIVILESTVDGRLILTQHQSSQRRSSTTSNDVVAKKRRRGGKRDLPRKHNVEVGQQLLFCAVCKHVHAFSSFESMRCHIGYVQLESGEVINDETTTQHQRLNPKPHQRLNDTLLYTVRNYHNNN